MKRILPMVFLASFMIAVLVPSFAQAESLRFDVSWTVPSVDSAGNPEDNLAKNVITYDVLNDQISGDDPSQRFELPIQTPAGGYQETFTIDYTIPPNVLRNNIKTVVINITAVNSDGVEGKTVTIQRGLEYLVSIPPASPEEVKMVCDVRDAQGNKVENVTCNVLMTIPVE